MSNRVDLDASYKIFQRTFRPLVFNIVDANGQALPTVASNYQWEFRIADEEGVTPYRLVKTNGATVLENINTSQTKVFLRAADLDLPGGRYWYTLARTDVDQEEVYVEGHLTILDR